MMKAVASFYKALLSFYPEAFRDEYRDEMLDVFQMRLNGVNGKLRTISIIFGEIIALPSSIFTIWSLDWRKIMKKQLNKYFDPAEGSLHEILLASLPIIFMYLVPGIITAVPGLEEAVPQPVGMALIIIMGGALVVLGVFGLLVGLPRWSLFYAGILLNGVIFLLLAEISFSFLREISKNSQLFIPIFCGLYAAAAAAVGFCGLWLSARVQELRWFFDKVRNDWPLLSLVSYGGSFLIILLQYEDLPGYSWQILVSGLFLMVGLIQFIRTKKPGFQLLGLIFWQAAAVVITGMALQDFISKSYPNLLYDETGMMGYLLYFLAASIAVIVLPAILPRTIKRGLFPDTEGEILIQE